MWQTSGAHNRTIKDLINLNVRDTTKNCDLNIKLALRAYCSAIYALTEYKPYFPIYGRNMRLPLDVLYRLPERDQSRNEYAIIVRKMLDQAYDVARNHLKLAHKRQKDYNDGCISGKRVKQRESMWLHTPLLKKCIAFKFYEPWTEPY